MATVYLIAVVAFGYTVATSLACTNAIDCELLGKCVNGKCECFRGFTGSSCGSLDLAPVDAKTRGQIWPAQPAPVDQQLSMAWSFTPIFDPQVQRCS